MNDKRAVTPSTVPASTLVLTRNSEKGRQVYLLRRNEQSSFMAGRYVFPGGRVDADDSDLEFWKTHVDLSPEEMRWRFAGSIPLEKSCAHAVAAIRETFEECGVLLARHRKGEGAQCQGANRLLDLNKSHRKGRFREWVAAGDWVLALSLVRPWSHWITPVVQPRLYDTWFYLASMPEGQECDPDQFEMTHGLWVGPGEALEANACGDLPLSPPTLVTLHEIAFGPSPASELERKNGDLWGRVRTPRLFLSSMGPILLLPWDSDFKEARPMGEEIPEKRVLQVGVPFSRLWLDKGIWRPVG